MVHAAVLAAVLVMPPDSTAGGGVVPTADPPVPSLPDSVWPALVERAVVVRLTTGEVVQGKLLAHEGDDIVLADATGAVTVHPKATIADVRIIEEEEVAQAPPLPQLDRAGPPVEVELPSRPIVPVDAPAVPRRLQWAGIGVLLGGVAAGGAGAWLWSNGYSRYMDAREAYYGSNGTCNAQWDPCGDRSDYKAEKRAADIRIDVGIAAVAVGSTLVATGVVMAIVGGVRASKSRRRGTLGVHPTAYPLPSLWGVRF